MGLKVTSKKEFQYPSKRMHQMIVAVESQSLSRFRNKFKLDIH
jgi:hypothetical protein